MTAAAAWAGAGARAGTRWSLLLGNFAIGCGVMVVPGALNDLARGLEVTVSMAGQLITVAAWVMAVSAPLLAALLRPAPQRQHAEVRERDLARALAGLGARTLHDLGLELHTDRQRDLLPPEFYRGWM